MKIYLDLSMSVIPHIGIATFSNSIISRIVKRYKDNTYYGGITVDRKTLRYRKQIKRYPFKVKKMILPTMISNHKWGIPVPSYNSFAGIRPDISIFWANFATAMPIKGKVLTVLHDLNPLYAEEGVELQRYIRRIKRTLDVSDRIVTVSEFSKKDIIEKFGYPISKIDVVYNGVDYDRFSACPSDDKLNEVKNKYGIKKEFFLYLGGTMPNKNIIAILDAIAELPEDIRRNYSFVCSNTKKYLVKHAKEIGVSDSVIFLNGIEEADKVEMYKLALFTVFVSLHEGFGIPVVEAQASGTPVITSNVSCLPEIAGEGACLVDPYSPESIADAMLKLITDDAYRESLIEQGKANALRFSWDKSAESFYDVICNMCK